MPSAANIKVDKQITSETASVDSASSQQNTPIRQAIVIIEHKIRNLEKRKSKLESYRELQNSGKDLNQDQRVAVAKYDEVVQTLEFARDLCKQFQGIATVADKETKKQARKEQAAKAQQEIAKVREILLVQDALQQLGQENIRENFLLGRNGAVTLTETDLKLLDDVYPEVSPKHEPGSTSFTTQVQSAAEHLLAIVDGKPKDAFGSTYVYVKDIIGKIHESGYLDQPTLENNVQEYTEEIQEAILEPEPIIEQLNEMPLDSTMTAVYHVEQPPPVVAAPVQPEEVPPLPQQQQQPQPQQQQQQHPTVPPTVLEQQQQPFYPPPRPISEVLGTGAFFFLQDSELDSPEQTPQQQQQPPQAVVAAATATTVLTNAVAGVPAAAIPSQTFTNQNFVAGFPPPNPPPPIPMPPSHLTSIEFAAMQYPAGYQQQTVIPTNVDEIQQQQQLHQSQQQPPVNQQPPPVQLQTEMSIRNGNGTGNENDGGKHTSGGGGDDHHPSAGGGGSPKNAPRSARNNQRRGQGGGGNYHQSYYQQHNNGYANNNRQRTGRGGGGPRSGGGAPHNRSQTQNNAANKQKAQH